MCIALVVSSCLHLIVLHGFIVLLVCGYVLYGCDYYVGIALCIVWVLSCCWYLIVYCRDLLVLLLVDCVLHRSYRVVDISCCIACVLSCCGYFIVYFIGYRVVCI